MLQILRTNQPLVIIVIAIYATVLNLHGFLLPVDWVPQNAGLLSHWLYSYIDINGVTAHIFAVILIVFQAVMISYCVNNYKISKSYSYFPAAFYLVILAFMGESSTLSPVLLGNTFIIIAMVELYDVYKRDAVFGNIFNIGFWLSIGSLFYTPVAIFLVFGFLGISVLRTFRFKEWLVMVIGFLVPLFLLWTWFFAKDGLHKFVQLQFSENLGFLDFAFTGDLALYARIFVLGFCMLVILFHFREYLYKRNIQTQKYINLLVWATFILAFTPLFQQNVQLEHFIMIAIPFSIFLSMSFLKIKTKPIAEFLFILIFLGVLIWQYQSVFLGLLRG